MGLGVRFHRTAELVPPAGQGQTRRHARDDAPGHRPGRPDHTGLVRLRTLRHRRGAPALPDHRGQLRKTEHHLRHEHRVRHMGHGLRGRQTRRRDRRPHRAPRAAPRVRGPEPPRRRGPHVRQEHLRATGKIRKIHATA